jgi:hypothetical protein
MSFTVYELPVVGCCFVLLQLEVVGLVEGFGIDESGFGLVVFEVVDE